MEWISVKDRLPESGVRVLFYCRNELGKGRTTLGIYAARFAVESKPNNDLFDRSEQAGDKDSPHFLMEGWYEEPYESEYYYPTRPDVTHWSPIQPPEVLKMRKSLTEQEGRNALV